MVIKAIVGLAIIMFGFMIMLMIAALLKRDINEFFIGYEIGIIFGVITLTVLSMF